MTIVPPKIDQKFNTYVYPGIDSYGTVYVAYAAFPPRGGNSPAETAATNHLWVTKSTDDGVTFGPFVQASTAHLLEGGAGTLPNTTFRDGITENFAVSPTYPGHLYLTFKGYPDRSSVDRFRGALLQVPESMLPELPEVGDRPAARATSL